MPIYEYECRKCGEFEHRQSLNDPALTRCPTCKSKVTKIISSSAFQLKGGGWYSDAYQKKASSPASTSSATSASAPASTSTSGSGSGGGSTSGGSD